MIALDTSVVVAAFASWHESHGVAVDHVRAGAVIPAHVLAETFAVLTRMPEPFPIDLDSAATYLHTQWHDRILVPDARLYSLLPRAASHARVRGGATYDALVGLTAHQAGCQLVSLDARAERTYRALGIDYRIIGGE